MRVMKYEHIYQWTMLAKWKSKVEERSKGTGDPDQHKYHLNNLHKYWFSIFYTCYHCMFPQQVSHEITNKHCCNQGNLHVYHALKQHKYIILHKSYVLFNVLFLILISVNVPYVVVYLVETILLEKYVWITLNKLSLVFHEN